MLQDSVHGGQKVHLLLLLQSTHVDGALILDEPSPEHGLDLTMRELGVTGRDPLHYGMLQDETAEPPVEEGPRLLPFQDFLRRQK